MNEDKIILDINLPAVPNDIDESLRNYLIELNNVLEESLRGSMLLRKTLEDGIFGN